VIVSTRRVTPLAARAVGDARLKSPCPPPTLGVKKMGWRMEDLDIISDDELAFYVSRAETARDFARDARERERLAHWLAMLLREREWRERLTGQTKPAKPPERSRILADIATAALLAA
jgi:hypothetical protein